MAHTENLSQVTLLSKQLHDMKNIAHAHNMRATVVTAHLRTAITALVGYGHDVSAMQASVDAYDKALAEAKK